MNLVERVHAAYASERRVRVLVDHLLELIPNGAKLLDVGCGDGHIDQLIAERRRDVEVEGIDVMVRPDTRIPVKSFDGLEIPCDDCAFDVVLFLDVLHHSRDPIRLLREGARVSRKAIVIKDHLRKGFLAGPTLRFMDDVGNARHGVDLPYDYWPEDRWHDVFAELGLAIEVWRPRLGLYPWPASWLFDRSLHFLARLGAR